MSGKTSDIARELLGRPTDHLEVLKIHQFRDDKNAHDDALQSRLEDEFIKSFEEAAIELVEHFGGAVRFEGDDHHVAPLCGVFAGASWEIAGRVLYLAAAHEDRECPYLLVVGTGSPSPG